jgi:phosphomannomutase
MESNQEIFKAYDIRGIYRKDFDDETAYKIGRAYVELRQEESDQGKFTIVVARDMRLSSPQLKDALIKGIIDAGADVVDIDLASTPTFYFAVGHGGYDGGIIVSASHNPPEWNGFKITRAKALPVSRDTGMNILRDKVVADVFRNPKAPGKITRQSDILTAQIYHDLTYANLEKIKPLNVVIDPANGMGAQYFDALFKRLPIKLIRLNWELDGRFPAHEADPLKEENMDQLKNAVLKEKADFGIATDGDGDRIFFVDDKGKTIDQSIIRGVLAMIFLKDKPGSKVCYDIRPGRITRDLILAHGGVPIVTPVGHSLIKEQAIKEGAYFAGESSGHFFLNMEVGCFEVPIITTLKLLEEFSLSGKSVSKYIKPYQKYYHSGEINSVVPDKEGVFKKIENKYHDAKINRMDGITVEYDDFWFNVRGSNTEPKIRLNLEATSKKMMEKNRDEILQLINQ